VRNQVNSLVEDRKFRTVFEKIVGQGFLRIERLIYHNQIWSAVAIPIYRETPLWVTFPTLIKAPSSLRSASALQMCSC
jgi:hypothetical protein